MNRSLPISLALVALISGPAVQAEIYAYLDGKGRRYYTDKPLEEAVYRPVNSAARKARLEQRDSRRRNVSRPSAGRQRAQINQLIDKWAGHYTLDPELVKAVVQVESDYRPDARSSANAQGLMQLMPATASRFGVTDPWDPEQNLRGGMAYLQWLLSQFKGDLRLVLAAYNAGENNVVKHKGVPPFRETQRYLQKITRLYDKRWHAYSRRDL